MGVNRAINKALDLSKTGEVIYTWGPVIHNPQVIEELKKKNVHVTEDLKDKNGETLIIRTHGVSPQEKSKIEESMARICDLTCPRVSKVQKIIQDHAASDYSIVIVGDGDHPEVKALIGFSGGQGLVINSEQDIEKISDDTKVCVVSQTTMDQNKFNYLSEKIRKRFKDAVVFNTICDSTWKRQNEVLKMCEEVEAMIVIGGKNSANTTRLAEISKETGVRSYHIETEKELDFEELKNFKAIGVTGGASTPDWMIKRVMETLEDFAKRVG